MKVLSKALVGGALLSIGMTAWAAHHEDPNATLAMSWVKASHTGKAETIAMVEKHMAADGVFEQNRYVGFGFSFDPQNDEEMVIVNVTPGSPASAVLKEGDVFVSVGDIPATRENRDRMSFRGKPGEAVKAVIRRGDETMPIEVKRGVIASTASKALVLENMARADAETWPVTEGKIVEVMSKGNVVYVVHEIKDMDDDVGLPFENRVISRFEFNDAGQVASVRNQGESRFVLEQTGYTISR
jgi:hypothetical protein